MRQSKAMETNTTHISSNSLKQTCQVLEFLDLVFLILTSTLIYSKTRQCQHSNLYMVAMLMIDQLMQVGATISEVRINMMTFNL